MQISKKDPILFPKIETLDRIKQEKGGGYVRWLKWYENYLFKIYTRLKFRFNFLHTFAVCSQKVNSRWVQCSVCLFIVGQLLILFLICIICSYFNVTSPGH